LSPATEHRIYDRLPSQNKVKIKGPGRLALYAIAINLSLGGVLLNATPGLPVGSQCQVALSDGSAQPVLAQGTVVRSDTQGTAIRFASVLPSDQLQDLVAHGRPDPSLLDAYRSYFQVGRNEDNAGCERLLGVTPTTFRRVFYTTFSASLPAAVLPVWFMRAAIQPFPLAAKVVACFLYGALWYFLLQPTLDVAILRLLRKSKGSDATA